MLVAEFTIRFYFSLLICFSPVFFSFVVCFFPCLLASGIRTCLANWQGDSASGSASVLVSPSVSAGLRRAAAYKKR